MAMHLQTLVKLSQSVLTTNTVSPAITHATSSFKRIIKFKSKDGSNLSFLPLSPKFTSHVINKVVAPAFLSDANYTYLYPKLTDRKLAVFDRFNNLIPNINNAKSVNSYILYDDDKQQHIGHVLLYSPSTQAQPEASESTEEFHEDNGRKFSRQLIKISSKLSSGIKMLYLSAAMSNEYKLISDVVSCGYWEISCVSINPSIQSTGYGTVIMNNVHKIIKYGNENNYNYNTPIILFTSTPSALRFYKRLGYKLFMEHNINSQVTSYSLIYHHDEAILKLWMKYLKKNIPYYHNINRYSLLPQFVRNIINKKKK
eukprot:710053_1